MRNRQRNSFSFQYIATLACVLALAGCQIGPPSSGAAERVASEYYQAIKAQDLAGAVMFYQDTNVQPREQWLQQLEDQREKLGDLQSYELVETTVNTVFSGVRYILRYKTRYTQATATETLIMFESVSDSKMVIQGLTLRSRAL